MHMANELLSVPVAAGTLALAGGALSFICKKAKQTIPSDKLALMGIMGAFVFAAQMVNFQLPLMPGTSGHMVGAVLLAIILGPSAGAIVISSVVIIQCLFFQDGGLLALGCNIINMAIVPSYLGYFVYKTIMAGKSGNVRMHIATMSACLVGIEAGAILVPIQVAVSGVLTVPIQTFLITMMSIHLLIGLIEGFITMAVIGYLRQVRGDILSDAIPGKLWLSHKMVLITLLAITLITATGLSLLASGKPDGLEYSYAERPDDDSFEPIVSNESPVIAAVDNLHAKISPMPDYSPRTSTTDSQVQPDISAGWTSLAGIVGSLLTMAVVWLAARLLRKNNRLQQYKERQCTIHI